MLVLALWEVEGVQLAGGAEKLGRGEPLRLSLGGRPAVVEGEAEEEPLGVRLPLAVTVGAE